MHLTSDTFYVHRLVTFDALAYLFRQDKQYIFSVSLACGEGSIVTV